MPVARIDINRIDLAVVLSLLIHGLIVAIPVAKRPGEIGKLSAPAPFIARLVDAPTPKAEPIPEAVREPTTPVVKPRPTPAPKVAAIPPMPAPPVERPAPPVETAERPAPQFDMLATIKARRDRRRDYEEALLRQQEARDSPNKGSAADPALASIQRNLQTLNAGHEGTGGVFTILSKGTRTGEFAFNGWRPESNRRWREVIEVDAGQGGDLELAMVRRMIELIRGHYDGDFVWKSNRLGRPVVMSARADHQAELEAFLLREFFDTATLAHKR